MRIVSEHVLQRLGIFLQKKAPCIKGAFKVSKLYLCYIYSFRSLGTFFDIKADCITFGKGLKAIALDG